jgi:hypothetical protein
MTETNIGGVYSLLDLLKYMDPSNGRLLFVAEVLSRKSPVIKEAPILEANQALTHIGTRTTSLPTVGKRAINDGVTYQAHKEQQITAPMSLFETMSKVDEEIIKLAGSNAAGVRQRKDAAFIEAITQAVEEEIFYGSLGDDDLGFNGLATLFASTSTYPNGDSTWYYNVLSGGGSGSDTTSIWLIEWGADKVHLIYPKGTKAGIEVNDMGKQLVSGVTTSTQYVAYVTQFKWRCGLFVSDERCVQRIANVETSGTSNTFDDDDLITMINRLPDMGENPMTRIYVNRTIRTQMDIKVKDKNNVNYTSGTDAFGKPTLQFRGIPVQVADQIVNTETAI